jgi:predicted histidine transporter YuiF (NhaC family)
MTELDESGNIYAGTFWASVIATLLTVAVPLIMTQVELGRLMPIGILFALTLFCVGLPAWFGVVFLMIPVDRLVTRRSGSAWLGAVSTVVANCALVALVGLLMPSNLKRTSDFGYPQYLAFAVYAALVWLACDRLHRRTKLSG